MSTPLTFQENATPVVRAIQRDVQSRAAAQAVGIGVRRVVRQWLRDLDSNRPSKHAEELPGSQSTHYFAQAAQSVTAPEVAGNKVTISITQVGMRQRLLGGPIQPVKGKYLTIPASGLSYGTRASEFTDLRFAFVRDEDGFLRPALVAKQDAQYTGTVTERGDAVRGSTGKKLRPKKKNPITIGDVIFWLVRSVNQAPDPGVIPGPDYIQAGAIEGLRAYLHQARPTYPQSGGAQ
jgi:hypothetical protein